MYGPILKLLVHLSSDLVVEKSGFGEKIPASTFVRKQYRVVVVHTCAERYLDKLQILIWIPGRNLRKYFFHFFFGFSEPKSAKKCQKSALKYLKVLILKTGLHH